MLHCAHGQNVPMQKIISVNELMQVIGSSERIAVQSELTDIE